MGYLAGRPPLQALGGSAPRDAVGLTEPAELKARPHHGRFPIPFVTHIREDGRPDFRVHDNARRADCAAHRLCQLCGTALGDVICFVGQRHSVERRTFGEPPMHEACLEWAWEVCPFLAGGTWRPEWKEAAEELTILPNPPSGDPFMGIWKTRTYKLVADEEGSGSVKWVAGDLLEPIDWRRRDGR